MVDFSLQELSQSCQSFLMQRFIDELSEDKLVNVSPMRESEAHSA